MPIGRVVDDHGDRELIGGARPGDRSGGREDDLGAFLGVRGEGQAAGALCHLGRPVRLVAVPRGGVIYGGTVSVLSTASLNELARDAVTAVHDVQGVVDDDDLRRGCKDQQPQREQQASHTS